VPLPRSRINSIALLQPASLGQRRRHKEEAPEITPSASFIDVAGD